MITALHTKQVRTAKAIRRWASNIIGDMRLQSAIASEVVRRLDVAQEVRQLSPQELEFRKALKSRLLGLAAAARVRRCEHQVFPHEGERSAEA